MPIQLPNLDNKTFDVLMKEMIASIPKHTKEWTNFNPSDPGIAMLELLAWISETLIYRTNRIPEESYMNFLMLISSSYRDNEGRLQHVVFDKTDKTHIELNEYLDKIENDQITKDIQQMKAKAQNFLNSRCRAVTEEDFRKLTLEADSKIKRAEVFTQPERVEIIIIPEDKNLYKNSQKTAELIKAVRNYLEPRRLIGTIINVKMAVYTPVNLKVTLVCESYAKPDLVGGLVKNAIATYLDSVKGGPDGKGWPYGRNLMVYELFYVIEKIESVKYVKKITESGKPFVEIEIKGLIEIDIENIEVIIEVETGE